MSGANFRTLAALHDEMVSARKKHPGNAHLLAALTEELGETAQALLDTGNSDRMREEAIQVACVALRLYEEGDGTFE